MKKSLLLVLLVGCLICVVACDTSGGKNYFAFRDCDFRAEVRGSLNGVGFCAEITMERMGEERRVGVSYLAPESLAGTELSALCDAKGEVIGEVEILRAGKTFSGDGVAFSGLLLPATGWFSPCEIVSVQKSNGRYLLSFSGGELLELREDGRPILLTAEELSMEMVWMEENEN